MPNISIKLLYPIEGHDGQITEIVLREPRYGDLMLLGEPASFGQSAGGIVYQAERDDVVKAYIERLLVSPDEPALLLQLGLTDALKLKDAVFGFFSAAKKAIST